MKTLALFSMLVLAQLSFAQKSTLTWHTDINEAVAYAQKSRLPMMLFFTGSDWCGWCHKLQAAVFNTPEFEKWAKENVVLVELDFPRAKEQTEALKQQNRSLQQQFGVRGYPTCWFVTPVKMSNGNIDLKPLGSKGYGPDSKIWITEAEALLNAN